MFLREAEHALVDPLHPTAFDYPWNLEPERLSTIVPTGPMGAWALVPAIMAGGSETVAHLTTLAFLWLAILATVSLGLQLGWTGHGPRRRGCSWPPAPRSSPWPAPPCRTSWPWRSAWPASSGWWRGAGVAASLRPCSPPSASGWRPWRERT